MNICLTYFSLPPKACKICMGKYQSFIGKLQQLLLLRQKFRIIIGLKFKIEINKMTIQYHIRSLSTNIVFSSAIYSQHLLQNYEELQKQNHKEAQHFFFLLILEQFPALTLIISDPFFLTSLSYFIRYFHFSPYSKNKETNKKLPSVEENILISVHTY